MDPRARRPRIVGTHEPIRIFIPCPRDRREHFHHCLDGLIERTGLPIAVVPLIPEMLRDRGLLAPAAGYATARFLAPFLCDFKGWAITLDPLTADGFDVDMTMLRLLANPGKAVYRDDPSTVVFDASKCTALTPEFIADADLASLHDCAWIPPELVVPLVFFS